MQGYDISQVWDAVVDWIPDNHIGQAALLGQMDVETDGYTRQRENMNYSAAQIRQIDPSLSDSLVAIYADHPNVWANYYYSNNFARGRRLGNGDVASNDGWNFRGMGLIQLSGRLNVTRYVQDKFGQTTSVDRFVKEGRLQELYLLPTCFEVVKWFLANLHDAMLDTSDLEQINEQLTYAINGRYATQTTIDERLARSKKYLYKDV